MMVEFWLVVNAATPLERSNTRLPTAKPLPCSSQVSGGSGVAVAHFINTFENVVAKLRRPAARRLWTYC